MSDSWGPTIPPAYVPADSADSVDDGSARERIEQLILQSWTEGFATAGGTREQAEAEIVIDYVNRHASTQAKIILDILAEPDEAMDEAGSAEFSYRLRNGWLGPDADEHFESIAAIRSAMMQAAKKP